MLDKQFDILQIEEKWLNFWQDNDIFLVDIESSKTPFCLMLPPPNVTGRLHMGHAFQQTLMDILIRYHRMIGKEVLWQVGTDHAGIATQMLVERQIKNENNLSRFDIGRDKFLEKVWQWKELYAQRIVNQMKRLGTSADWSRLRFTMDTSMSKAVKEAFIYLYKQGYIYKGNRLVNWDPSLMTAVSDLEVVAEEVRGSMWHILYPFTDGPQEAFDSEGNKVTLKGMTIATTRPETMLADGAVCVNPNDKRYKHLVGKYVDLPLCNRTIPVIEDDFVDIEFGTGCVKITGAHDFNDYACAIKHNIPLINIFTLDAKLNENAPKQFFNMDRFNCRKEVVKELKQNNFLVGVDENHKMMQPKSERTGVIVEPMLTNQWFISMKKHNEKGETLSSRALNYFSDREINFIPANWLNTYNQWLNNIQDWCISRQLWWGHQIPAWYDDNGKVYVGYDEDSIRKEYNLSANIKLKQDEDVLDTWFSSGIWTFSTLGYPDNTRELEKFHPTDVLITGFDIIFFWVARMVMMTGVIKNQVPFREVYITGLVRDSDGNKMSKTKGNVIDPLDVIQGIGLEDLISKSTESIYQKDRQEKAAKGIRKMFPEGIQTCGVDSLRFTFCALANTGRDIRFDIKRVMGYRNFTNKVWNAARFVFSYTEDFKLDNNIDYNGVNFKLRPFDQWIINKIVKFTERYHKYIKEYRFDMMSQEVYELIWDHYCDWYLEASKVTLKDQNIPFERKYSTQYILLYTLDCILRLLHPITPFITEEIWASLKGKLNLNYRCLSVAPIPEVNSITLDKEIIENVETTISVIHSIRQIRGDYVISPNKKVDVIIVCNDELKTKLEDFEDLIKDLAKVSSIKYMTSNDKLKNTIVNVINNLQVHVYMHDLIDKEQEIIKINKEIDKNQNNINILKNKLSNNEFISKAKLEIVQKEKDRLKRLDLIQKGLIEQKSKLEQM